MSKSYTQQFPVLANEIVTDAVVFPSFNKGELPSINLHTKLAAWDTGSEQTIISPYVAEALELKPLGKEPLNGLGGIQDADSYIVSIGLPNMHLFRNIKVCCLPIDDYEVLIGMDIISKCGFAITNQGGKTTFSFQTPSSTTIDFRESQ